MKLLLLVFRIKLSWKRIRQVLSKNALLSIQLQTLILQILQRLRQSEIQRKVRCFFGSIKLVLGSCKKGVEIKGLDAVLSDPSVKVYHMGTTLKKLGEGHESYDKAGHSLVTNGGRVLMVLASAPDLKSAHDKALEAVSKVDCDNLFHRTDIGHWAFE